MTDVRVATPADLDEVMKLAVAAAKENSFLDASTELLVRAVWGPINQDHGIIGCIGAPGKQLEGMVVLKVGKVFYSDVDCLEELTVYVRPEFRSLKSTGPVGRAAMLVDFSKAAASMLGLPLLIGVLSNERTEAKCRLYERMLGKPSGKYWLWQARTGGHEVTA